MPGREEFKREYLESIAETCSKPFAECSRMERYTALAAMIRECCSGVRAETLRRRAAAGEKIVYYFSMEFLVGRLLENYLIQLGIRDMTADILAELGEDLDALLECERDPGLGNGGLGRLAACYLDSLARGRTYCDDRQHIGDRRRHREPALSGIGHQDEPRQIDPRGPRRLRAQVRHADSGAPRAALRRTSEQSEQQRRRPSERVRRPGAQSAAGEEVGERRRHRQHGHVETAPLQALHLRAQRLDRSRVRHDRPHPTRLELLF